QVYQRKREKKGEEDTFSRVSAFQYYLRDRGPDLYVSEEDLMMGRKFVNNCAESFNSLSRVGRRLSNNGNYHELRSFRVLTA
ncbi:MAG: hypothetical protein AABX62_01875, partial [Thermoproteota archaeon]